MKNFDEAHDVTYGGETVTMASREEILGFERDFTVGGQTFTRKAILHPRIMARFWGLDGAIDESTIEAIYAIALDCVEPTDRERLKARLDDVDDPISYITLRELIAWFITEDTGRPFERPKGSTPGSATTEASMSSTDGSSSPESEAAPKASLSVAS